MCIQKQCFILTKFLYTLYGHYKIFLNISDIQYIDRKLVSENM